MTTAAKKSGSDNLAGGRLLAKLKNTMSDQAAPNIKFNQLLESYREEVLPSVRDDWETLSDTEKNAVKKKDHHFCAMYVLVNLDEQVQWGDANMGEIAERAWT